MTAKDLYDHDFVEWTRSNAALLRAGRFDEVDCEHLAEEIEDMGISQEHAIGSRLLVILEHLLKLQAEPGSRAKRGWKATVKVQRLQLRRLLRRAPSLRRLIREEVEEVYEAAVSSAAAGTDLPEDRFPNGCPFSIEQILDDQFFP